MSADVAKSVLAIGTEAGFVVVHRFTLKLKESSGELGATQRSLSDPLCGTAAYFRFVNPPLYHLDHSVDSGGIRTINAVALMPAAALRITLLSVAHDGTLKVRWAAHSDIVICYSHLLSV